MDSTPRLLVPDAVVSDTSRFEYEKHMPRKRLRKPLPLELTTPPFPSWQLNETPPPHAASDMTLDSARYDMRDDLYDYYAAPSLASLRERPFTPYPTLNRANHPLHELENPPLPPPKDSRSQYGSRHVLQIHHDDQLLPPVQDTRDYVAHQQDLLPQRTTATAPVQDTPEQVLLERLINRPLFLRSAELDRPTDPALPPPYIFTAYNVIDFFQICFGIIVTTLASVLASTDDRIDTGLYRYFIAVGVIVLVVGLLFISKTINFERRKGVFYCLLACILTGVALVLSITSVATNNNCQTSGICLMRKVLATFSILSFILWVCTLMVFLTVLYMCRVIFHHDIPLDFDAYNEKVAPPTRTPTRTPSRPPTRMSTRPSTYYKEDTSLGYMTDTTDVDDMRHSRRYSQLLPRYFFDENGKMYPLDHDQDLRGTRPMLVYAPETMLH